MEEYEKKQEVGMPSIGIPAEVLFNPYLTYLEKILFGFIRNLAQTKNGCWASNRYLGILLHVGEQTISNSVAKLKTFKYIRTIYERTEEDQKYANNQRTRKIFINEEYPKIYRELVEEAHEVYIKNNGAVLENLYTTIKNIISLYKISYNKEDIKNDIKEDIKEISSKEEIKDSEKTESSNSEIPLQGRRGKALRREKEIILAQRPVEETPPKQPPKNIPEELRIWNGSGLTQHKTNTKLYQDIVRSIKKLKAGTFFNQMKSMEKVHDRKFTQEEIVDTIFKFSEAVTNPDYAPVDKKYLKSLSFITFLYNPFCKNGDSSQFLYYLHHTLIHPLLFP